MGSLVQPMLCFDGSCVFLVGESKMVGGDLEGGGVVSFFG